MHKRFASMGLSILPCEQEKATMFKPGNVARLILLMIATVPVPANAQDAIGEPLSSLVAKGAIVNKMADGFYFTEGPAADLQGKRLNSPNDLWIDAKGGIYFSDPGYGNRDNVEQNGKTLFITARKSIYSIPMTVNTAKPGNWTTLECNGAPDGRHETTFVEFQGMFYLIGGRESNKIDRFDPETQTWSKMKAESPLIHHFQPVLWNNKIYMAGAMTGNYPDEPPMTNIQIYDPTTDEWSEGGEIPKERRRGSAGTVVYNGKIYMACGIELGHTSGTSNWFDEYDPATDTWKVLPDAPHKRDHFHAVVLDDKLYCIGGRRSDYHEPGNFGAFFGAVIPEIDCYDFRKGKWTTLDAKLPIGSAAAGVAVLDGRIIYFGGETAAKGPAQNTTWAFDPINGTWTELARMNQGRHGSQAIVYGNKIYIAAGSPNRGGGNVQSIEEFSF